MPRLVMAWSISDCALSGLQSGVSYSAPTLRPLESITLWAPFLNRVALLSVGAPLIITMVPSVVPSALSLSTRAWPWSLPTCSLSNEM